MRIAVVGAGAMGSIFGARFAQGGHETVLVDVAAPLVEQINASGVTIVRGDDETTTPVAATTDTVVGRPRRPRRLLRQVLPHAVGGGRCAPARRARHGGRIAAERLGERRRLRRRCSRPSRSWSASRTTAASSRRPARIVHPADQPTLVGSYVDDAGDGAARLAQVLSDSGFEASVASPVRPEIWKKLILNAATLPTAALTGMNAGALTAHAGMKELVSETAREAVAVAQAQGYVIDADERVDAIHALLEKAGPTRASMLQDFEAGRQTEIDVVNGAVVRAGDEHGVAVPLNRAFVQLVKGWESMRGLG